MENAAAQMSDERDEGGRFAAEHDDGDFLDAVAAHEPAGTREVADAVGVTRQNADQRLRRLRDDGAVQSKKVGRELIWMSVDEPETD